MDNENIRPRGAGAVLVRVRFAGAGAVLVRVKISRCGFHGAGAANFFGAVNARNNINDLSKFFDTDLLVRINKDILLNFRCIDSTFYLQHCAVTSTIYW